MANPLRSLPPPPRRIAAEPEPAPTPETEAPPVIRKSTAPKPAVKFRQIKEDERVQFNKRITRRVADGFEMLAIRSHRKVPDLLAEALDLLEERYGRVG